MYNSLPMDMIEGPLAKVEKIEDKLQLFIDYARKFGVPEVKFSVSTKKVLQILGVFILSCRGPVAVGGHPQSDQVPSHYG